MAHKTEQEIDDQAAALAASREAPGEQAAVLDRPTLAFGAEGENVTKLVNLLEVLGFDTNSVIKGAPARLEESVLADVRAFRLAQAVEEPAVDGLEGEVIGPVTWAALYGAVEAKLTEPSGA